ncbi:MAG: serine acetyltransferase [Jaaginema sp. PMC 1079.18]|nr:serine acetyltransferase [Jaaginema sp. PMC 1080.18]MEC4853609.1 serine acetyltransferase [Jaaginema sp. PMC 1079.18]MEC4868317.1 serine acetyltransferase [Jaaginema sp. PMC 1078.18]
MTKKSKIVKHSLVEPDWQRETVPQWWHPSSQLLKSIRRYQQLAERGDVLSKLLQKWTVLHYRFWSVVAAADIPINSKIKGGLKLPHPNGIVIHPNASIGYNCIIFQQVTIIAGVEIGSDVAICAGAKIIRPVKIGDRAVIGANAVVRTDVPAGATAVGIPARIIPNPDRVEGEMVFDPAQTEENTPKTAEKLANPQTPPT